MKGHEEIEQILASYRDATAEERARADEHMARCPACAERLAAFAEVDAKLGGLAEPSLPAQLAQPLSKVIAGAEQRAAARSATRGASPTANRFAFVGSLVPATLVLLVLVALSVLMVTLESGRTPVTSTPTLTTTLTPTMISARETEPAALIGYAAGPSAAVHTAFLSGIGPGPTPAPAPAAAPAPAPGVPNSQVLLAGFAVHAKISR